MGQRLDVVHQRWVGLALGAAGGGLVDDEESFDENDQPSRRAASAWRPSISGERALALLPHVPIVVVVPVARDIVLAPYAAAAFVTALGPLRRDRVAAAASIRTLAARRLSEAVAERLVDLWDARSERARTSCIGVAASTSSSLSRSVSRSALASGPSVSVAAMAASGVDRFHELGAGKVLTGLVKRIAPQASATAIGTPADIAAFAL